MYFYAWVQNDFSFLKQRMQELESSFKGVTHYKECTFYISISHWLHHRVYVSSASTIAVQNIRCRVLAVEQLGGKDQPPSTRLTDLSVYITADP
ncbi:hypothetical protein LDENG_00246470 [Lucifuga dentata]|nr:hypothetical protein LDENG_00246470 [Lucifuga dentata]